MVCYESEVVTEKWVRWPRVRFLAGTRTFCL